MTTIQFQNSLTGSGEQNVLFRFKFNQQLRQSARPRTGDFFKSAYIPEQVFIRYKSNGMGVYHYEKHFHQ